MKKILCIVGPTGTGKTNLALSLAKEYPSLLVSADSRQVFRGMDIVTGKDHPKDIILHGIDIVEPDKECSVAVWHDAIAPALSESELTLVVGGTGLYVKSVTEGIPTMHVPINHTLRNELEALFLSELQSRLQSLDAAKYMAMNNSDANNPRRLIRAIEINRYREDYPERANASRMGTSDSLIIGLQYQDPLIYQQAVKARVISRLKLGAVEETKKLLEKYDRNLPSMTAIGYRSLIDFIDGKLTKEQMIEKWTADELAYAKRQMTWFKKVPNIKWFDAADEENDAKIAKLVSKWYAKK